MRPATILNMIVRKFKLIPPDEGVYMQWHFLRAIQDAGSTNSDQMGKKLREHE
jgi:hypothetical protein